MARQTGRAPKPYASKPDVRPSLAAFEWRISEDELLLIEDAINRLDANDMSAMRRMNGDQGLTWEDPSVVANNLERKLKHIIEKMYATQERDAITV